MAVLCGTLIVALHMKNTSTDIDTLSTYDKIASSFSKSHFEPFWINEFDEFKKRIDGQKVIDIGCGAGRDAAVFVENGFDYTGIDASSGMLSIASTRVPRGKFMQMDFGKIDFPDHFFDGFWAAASFLHVPKQEVGKLIIEARRVIKPDGVGFVAMKEKRDIDEGFIAEDRYGGLKRYFSFYEVDEFANILQTCGFQVEKITQHPDPNTNWICFFVKR